MNRLFYSPLSTFSYFIFNFIVFFFGISYEQVKHIWKYMKLANSHLLPEFEDMLRAIMKEVNGARVEYENMERMIQK